MIYVDDVELIVEMWAGVNTILARDREETLESNAFRLSRTETEYIRCESLEKGI